MVNAPSLRDQGFLTRAETARMFDVREETIWAWERAGKFPKSVKIGRQVFYSTASIRAFMEEKERAA